jgi:hypothetical protein
MNLVSEVLLMLTKSIYRTGKYILIFIQYVRKTKYLEFQRNMSTTSHFILVLLNT